MLLLLIGIAAFLLGLVVIGLAADVLDPYGERADARRRNRRSR